MIENERTIKLNYDEDIKIIDGGSVQAFFQRTISALYTFFGRKPGLENFNNYREYFRRTGEFYSEYYRTGDDVNLVAIAAGALLEYYYPTNQKHKLHVFNRKQEAEAAEKKRFEQRTRLFVEHRIITNHPEAEHFKKLLEEPPPTT